MRKVRSEANYFSDPKRIRSQRAGKLIWMNPVLALLLIASVVVGLLGVNPLVAAAASSDDDSFDSGALDSAFESADPEQLNSYLNQLTGEEPSTSSFQYVLERLMVPDYINYLPHATVAQNAQEQANSIGFSPNGGDGYQNYVCHSNQTGAGTPIYHNCDVPNFSAEFAQNLYSLFDRSGPQNAFALNASAILFPSFGQSKALPGDSVPASTAGAAHKYTGLEVYGYGLQLSSYFGEWDHIQTLTQSRLLTNFSYFDSVNLTAQSIGNAIGGSFDRAGALSAQGWNSGGIFGAIAGFYSGLYEGGASNALNTLLDTSEANTVLTFGWYRSNYSETSYGLRELTNQEIIAQIRAGFLSYMNSTMPEDMSYDEWLKTTAPNSPLMSSPPKPPIATCTVYTTPNGGEVVHGTAQDTPPGITAEQCDELQTQAGKDYYQARWAGVWNAERSITSGSIYSYDGNFYQATRSQSPGQASPDVNSAAFRNVSSSISLSGSSRVFDLGTPDAGDGHGGWDEDGAAPAQSFNQWLDEVKATAGDWDANLEQYGIVLSDGACAPANADANDAAQAKAAYTNWLANCWTSRWNSASEANEIQNQTEINTTWLSSLLTGSTLAKWSANNPGAFEFNSPWSRYVCLNEDGSDVTNGTWSDTYSGGDAGAARLVPAFDSDGNVNPLCPQRQYRAPVQGGLFGDGYNYSQPDQNPGVDTRYISNFYGSSIAALYPFFLQPVNSLTQFMFTMGQFATQVSNEIITWTYLPILETLGVTDMVSNLIDSLRDGVFFPLAALVVAAAALYILYQAGVRRRYREMFISALYVALIFILGAALMTRPADVINLVDRVPANVEKALMAIIVGPSNSDDKLCTTDSSASSVGAVSETYWQDLDISAAEGSGNVSDIFSDSYNVSDDSLREVLCTNWKVFVYYPWVFAQWGTAPENLDADAMSNTNGELVGDAQVDLGGSNGVINNWATYQLSTMKIGSTTTVDWNVLGVTAKNKDFYRLVDLQAGPNNGAGTDPSYLQSWSGVDPFPRLITGFMSMVVAGVAAFTVAAYSFTKILVTFISVFMLIFLPIIFLLGLFPTRRRFVRDYVLTIVSFMIQRVALMVMISLFLLMLLTILTGANNYMSVFLGALLVCIMFLIFRKPILKFAMSLGGAGSNGLANMANRASNYATGMLGIDGGADARRAWGQTARAMNSATPTTVQNFNRRLAAGVGNAVVGGLAGAVTGKGVIRAADEWAGRRDINVSREIRHSGWGFTENIVRTRDALRQEESFRSRNDKALVRGLADLQAHLPELDQYFNALDLYVQQREELDERLQDGSIREVPVMDKFGDQLRDENGKPQFKYVAMETRHDPNTGETLVVEGIEIEKPVAPQRPTPVKREFTNKEIGVIRKYTTALSQKELYEQQQAELVKQLYATTGGAEIDPGIPADSSEAAIKTLLLKIMPDSGGFTDVSREKARTIIDSLAAINGQVDQLNVTLEQLSQQFQGFEREFEYENDPEAAQAAVVESLTRQEQMRGTQ